MTGDDDDGTLSPTEPSILDNAQPALSEQTEPDVPEPSQHHSLKHHLLGPSLTKAGQDAVDQKKVAEIIYEASKGSKFFNNEETKDKTLTVKIERILTLKAQLEKLDLKSDLRRADEYLASLELSRDFTQSIVHVDCDAFYAMVEELDRPELREVPMAVGKGVLTTCNYHARKFGCRSGMAGFVAMKLCPQLICLPLNFEKYTAKAKEVRAILADYDPRFESASIDEAYLNITNFCETNHIDPEDAVAQMRREVHEKCKITISAGIAPNAKIAKIASNKNKPNGQFQVPHDRAAIMSFMSTLPIRKVNGVGRVFERELQAIGIETCGDIYSHRAYLNRLFGEKAFEFLIQTYAGLGRTDVRPAEEYTRKSVGTESTFRDMSSKVDLREKLRHTAAELEKDLIRTGFKGRTLVLKIKLHTYEVFTRQVAPPKPVSTAEDLFDYSLPMLVKLEKDRPGLRLRLMGLRCTHLVPAKKDVDPNFFGPQRTQHPIVRAAPPFSENGEYDHDSGDEEWEVWPEEEFEAAALRERADDMAELERLSQEQQEQEDEYTPGHQVQSPSPEFHPPFGRYKTPSPSHRKRTPPSKPVVPEDETWFCPICDRPQPADDRAFNDHVDFCLSRQTIKEAVAVGAGGEAVSSGAGEDADGTSQVKVVGDTGARRPGSGAGSKRKAAPTGGSVAGVGAEGQGGGGRQKRLFFAR
ncbi:MAG: hypothetical protein Q9160_007035 [Pyrenula sp. 1 TL-2023]